MDLCSPNLNNRNLGLFTAKKSSFPQRNLWLETPFSFLSGKMGLFRNGHGKVSEIRVLKFRCSSYRPIVVKATAKKNDENSSSSGEVLPYIVSGFLGFYPFMVFSLFLELNWYWVCGFLDFHLVFCCC